MYIVIYRGTQRFNYRCLTDCRQNIFFKILNVHGKYYLIWTYVFIIYRNINYQNKSTGDDCSDKYYLSKTVS